MKRNFLNSIEISEYNSIKHLLIEFAVPNGEYGSGLTLLVGSNSSGKTSVIEMLDLVNNMSQRGRMATLSHFFNNSHGSLYGKKFSLKFFINNKIFQLKRDDKVIDIHGELHQVPIDDKNIVVSADKSWALDIYITDAHRYITNKTRGIIGTIANSRETYVRMFQSERIAKKTIGHNKHDIGIMNEKYPDDYPNAIPYEERVGIRMHAICAKLDDFNIYYSEITNCQISLELNKQSANHYLLTCNGIPIETTGDGIVNLICVIDAIYDSSPGDIIVIDEPERSLHPIWQKKLSIILGELSKDRQIIIATHSPYFIDWSSLVNKGKLWRMHQTEKGISADCLSENSIGIITNIISDSCNVHVLGLESKEIFFLQDEIILVEGQDDALLYPKISKQIGLKLKGNIFGWGVGGAEKMAKIVKILMDLGYQKVFGILDGDKNELMAKLNNKYKTQYKFAIIPAKDVRDKKPTKKTDATEGLTEKSELKDKYKSKITDLFNEIDNYFTSIG
ncbi:MAG: AAA family ATPase [Patescibacteria group bacterium]